MDSAALSIVFMILLGLIGNAVSFLTKEDLLPFGAHFGDEELEIGDDLSSADFQLEVPIVFFGEMHHSIYVNLNGLLTFGRDIYPYRNDFEVPFGYSSISPYYADIDTTASGHVYFRQSNEYELLRRVDELINQVLPAQRDFNSRGLFISTWENVGYFNAKSDQTNTFQTVIASDGHNSILIFLYQELNWYQAEDKDGSPALPAQAGYDSGDRTNYHVLPYSKTYAITNLMSSSNVGLDGVWVFEIGRANRDDHSVFTPPPPYPEPEPEQPTCEREGRYECHPDATCQDFLEGFCCQCPFPLMGNGIHCIPSDKTLRILGELKGRINGYDFPKKTVLAFIIPFDGRSYVAMNEVDESFTRMLFSLTSIGTTYAFLFAFPSESHAKRGFDIIGSNFNRTAEVRFSGSNDEISIRQRFTNRDGKFFASTEVYGSVPVMNVPNKLTMQIPKFSYRRTQPGLIRARNQQIFDFNNENLVVTVDDTIYYYECPFSGQSGPDEIEMAVTKGSIVIDRNTETIKFSQKSTIGVGNVIRDPCDNAVCDPNAMCQATSDGESYRCTCKDGFYGPGKQCYDVDECREGTHQCHGNAQCINIEGSYQCQCIEGFIGDGRNCQEQPTDLNSCKYLRNCDPNADCIYNPLEMRSQCVCRRGYQGNGYQCVYEGDEDGDCSRQPGMCHHDAECTVNYELRRYECRCREGFLGDGRRCQKIDCSQDPRICNQNARCERREDEYVCTCNPGFYGDGTHSCSVADTTEHGEGKLVYAQGMYLAQAPLIYDQRETGKLLSYLPGQLAVAVDVDCTTQSIFWTDVTSKSIRTSKMDGSEQRIIVQNLGSPEGLAVDWIAGNLYWTDSGFDKIQVSKLDGSHVKTLFSKNLTNPRSIVVDPIRGLLFWTDWNRDYPKIERSNLDGTDRRVLISEDLGLPNGLVLDYESQFLCWADAGGRKVECVTYEGRNRRVICDKAGYTFGLAYFNNIFYWTDWERNTIKNINKYSDHLNEEINVPYKTSGKLYGITVAKSSCPRGSNPCSWKYGNCRYLCFVSLTSGSTCACPDHVSPEECKRSAYLE